MLLKEPIGIYPGIALCSGFLVRSSSNEVVVFAAMLESESKFYGADARVITLE